MSQVLSCHRLSVQGIYMQKLPSSTLSRRKLSILAGPSLMIYCTVSMALSFFPLSSLNYQLKITTHRLDMLDQLS